MIRNEKLTTSFRKLKQKVVSIRFLESMSRSRREKQFSDLSYERVRSGNTVIGRSCNGGIHFLNSAKIPFVIVANSQSDSRFCVSLRSNVDDETRKRSASHSRNTAEKGVDRSFFQIVCTDGCMNRYECVECRDGQISSSSTTTTTTTAVQSRAVSLAEIVASCRQDSRMNRNRMNPS